MSKHCNRCGNDAAPGSLFCPRCGNSLKDATADPLLGTIVADRYLLVEKLGEGRAGVIYRGEHTSLRRKVAVKILTLDLSRDEAAVERFRRETTAVCEIDNDHLLQVQDFGRTSDGQVFFAMELLEGETLSAAIARDKALPVARVLDILEQAADALQEAHEQGHIHRDLRPRNLLLTRKRGRADFVKLLDFGLAELLLKGDGATGFGDARYVSPELARGQAFDGRADIYALGVIGFEMLSGAPPFTADAAKANLGRLVAVPSLRSRRAEVPTWLDTVIQHALAASPKERFATVGELIDCLKQQKAPSPRPPDEASTTPFMKVDLPVESAKPDAKRTMMDISGAAVRAAAEAAERAAKRPDPVAMPKVVIAPEPRPPGAQRSFSGIAEGRPVESRPAVSAPAGASTSPSIATGPAVVKPVASSAVAAVPGGSAPSASQPATAKAADPHPAPARTEAAAIAAVATATTAPTATVKSASTTTIAAPKAADTKAGDPKAADPKAADTKAADTKLADVKPTNSKPIDAKPAEGKPAETKIVDAKPAEGKPAEGKPAEARPAAALAADHTIAPGGAVPAPAKAVEATPGRSDQPTRTIAPGGAVPVAAASPESAPSGSSERRSKKQLKAERRAEERTRSSGSAPIQRPGEVAVPPGTSAAGVANPSTTQTSSGARTEPAAAGRPAVDGRPATPAGATPAAHERRTPGSMAAATRTPVGVAAARIEDERWFEGTVDAEFDDIPERRNVGLIAGLAVGALAVVGLVTIVLLGRSTPKTIEAKRSYDVPAVAASLQGKAPTPAAAAASPDETARPAAAADPLAAAKRVEEETLATDKRLAEEKLAAEQRVASAGAQQTAAEKIAAEKQAAADKAVADRQAAADKVAAEKQAAADKLAAEKQAAADKLAAGKQAVADKLAAEKQAAADKQAATKRLAEEKRIADAAKAAEVAREAEMSKAAVKASAEEKRLASEAKAAETRRLADERKAKEPRPAEDKKPARVAAAAPAAAPPSKKTGDGFRDPFATSGQAASGPSVDMLIRLGRQKLNAGDTNGALAQFTKAREIDGSSSDAIAGLGEAEFEQGDYTGAAVHLKLASKLAPKKTRYAVLLGQAYYKLGKVKEAAAEYKRALKLDPRNQEAAQSLEVAERKLGGG